MTDNAIVQWDPNSGAALPAYLAEAMGDLGSNIQDRLTVPSLSYEGKTWTIVHNGNKTRLQAANTDGDMVPVPVMRMVILGYNADRGRAYYPATYNPSQTAQPDCWSADGKTPDAGSKAKQFHTCNGCPMSIKGSKVQDGKEMVACSSHRMVAITPSFDILHEPLRLKIAVTSDYDKEIVEHGWFAFRQYTDYLKSRGITHTALVLTKAKFDSNVAYPKLLFALDRPLTPDEVAQAVMATKNPKVANLLAETWSAAGVNGTPTDDKDIRPHGLEGAVADGWIAHPDAAGYFYRGQEVVASAELAARYPEPEAPAAPPPPPVPAVPAAQQVIEGKVLEPATPEKSPREKALDAGWLDHPSAPGYMYLGQEVVLEADVLAKFPAAGNGSPATPTAAAAPTAPETTSAPASPTVPAASPSNHDPIAAALADGWQPHPSAPGYHYKGQEVVADGDLAAKYPPASEATPAAPAGSASGDLAAVPAGSSDGTTAAASASPSDGELPADVAALLSKWNTD